MKPLLISILFCLTILSRLLFELGWEIYFVVNQDRIAAEKCVNREKPALKCNGKCYLARQLALEQKTKPEPEKVPANPFHLKTDIACLSFRVHPVMKDIDTASESPAHKLLVCKEHVSDERYFHPPQYAL